jgi:hypothetical protein
MCQSKTEYVCSLAEAPCDGGNKVNSYSSSTFAFGDRQFRIGVLTLVVNILMQ